MERATILLTLAGEDPKWLEQTLAPLGHRVLVAGERRRYPDDVALIVVGEDGGALLAPAVLSRSPVIALLAGAPSAARTADAHARGALDVLYRPFDADALRAKIDAYVRFYRNMLEGERRARASAESASRAKDEFLATVSHELRNPLNAILGWARVLLDDPDVDPERRQKGLDVILRNAKAQVQLVADILEVSRIVTGRLRLSTRPIDVGLVVEAAIETVRAAAQAKRVALRTALEENLGSIIADEDRVQQILWNLLSNAVKFTPSGGTIDVHVRRGDIAIELVVKDTGEGIDPDFLPYVFDRFRQFDGSTTRTHGGLGLGLAIVRHLAELHGGTVEATSPGRGYGAAFVVTLPLLPLDESEENRSSVTSLVAARVEPGNPLTGRSILLLDDDPDMRDLIAMILEDAGATVLASGTVRAALGVLERERPDVAISDIAMPEEDGFAFVKYVRSSPNERVRRAPLVAMTAYARAEDRRRVLLAGFDRHVTKPIEPEELVNALLSLLEPQG